MSVRVLDEYLIVNENHKIQCNKCEHIFCNENENYKTKAVIKERDFYDMKLTNVKQKYYIDRKVIFRQFFCPGCATNIENDVVYENQESLDDKKIVNNS